MPNRTVHNTYNPPTVYFRFIALQSEAKNIRAENVIRKSDALIAFWDGKCNMIALARRRMLQVAVVRYDQYKY